MQPRFDLLLVVFDVNSINETPSFQQLRHNPNMIGNWYFSWLTVPSATMVVALVELTITLDGVISPRQGGQILEFTPLVALASDRCKFPLMYHSVKR